MNARTLPLDPVLQSVLDGLYGPSSQAEQRDEEIRKAAAHSDKTIRAGIALDAAGMKQPDLMSQLDEAMADAMSEPGVGVLLVRAAAVGKAGELMTALLDQCIAAAAHAEAVKHVERLEYLAAQERRLDRAESCRIF